VKKGVFLIIDLTHLSRTVDLVPTISYRKTAPLGGAALSPHRIKGGLFSHSFHYVFWNRSGWLILSNGNYSGKIGKNWNWLFLVAISLKSCKIPLLNGFWRPAFDLIHPQGCKMMRWRSCVNQAIILLWFSVLFFSMLAEKLALVMRWE
jgi:hypothetical protein